MENEFEVIWRRIKLETNLKSLQSLANIIKISQPAVSEMKAKKKFPPGWAYLVGKEFGLLTEWIMTGEGPKRIEELSKSRKFRILDELEEWLSGEIKADPGREIWFEIQAKDSFTAFKAWKEEKEGKAEVAATWPASKVA